MRLPPPPWTGRSRARAVRRRRGDHSPGGDRPSARALPPGRLGQELRHGRARQGARRPGPEPDRRQRPPQVGVDPGAQGRARTGSESCGSSSTSGRARCPTRTWTVHDEGALRLVSRSGRGRSSAASIADPILDDFWPRAVRRAQGRAGLWGCGWPWPGTSSRAAWGVSNLEIPLSQVCQTEGFLWFASHLLAQLAAIPGDPQRGPGRVPRGSTGSAARTIRSPRWASRASGARPPSGSGGRGSRAGGLCWSGRTAHDALADRRRGRPPDRAAALARSRGLLRGRAAAELAARSIRLRTRALTTTMFCRYLLGDLFIHGIGGAKYDELGDAIARRFFGIEPPGFLTLSLTAWLGLPDQTATSSAACNARSSAPRSRLQSRSPSRPNHFRLEVRNLIKEKREAIARESSTRRERIARFRAIRAINEALQEPVRESARFAASPEVASRCGPGMEPRGAWSRVRLRASLGTAIAPVDDGFGLRAKSLNSNSRG